MCNQVRTHYNVGFAQKFLKNGMNPNLKIRVLLVLEWLVLTTSIGTLDKISGNL